MLSPNRQNQRPKQAILKRRHISPDALNALAGAVRREWDSLPPDSPRRRPTLPRLAFMTREADIIEVAP
jgi:hypothetical protein